MAAAQMNHKEYYKDVMSKRDFDYFDTYSESDQQGVIEETRRQLHLSNVRRMKECVQGNRVTALMGLVSHELRTPLNALIGIIDLMQADKMTPDQRLYIQSLEQSSTYLSSVVSRLQDFAALMHGQAMVHSISFDMVAIVTGIAEAMQHFIEQEKEKEGTTSHIELHLDPKLPLVVYGDLTKIQQILRNLATIAVTSSTDRHASIKIDLLDDGPTVHMRVTVTSINNTTPAGLLDGIGIEFSPEELFKPTSYNNMYQGLVISREFLYMIDSHLETSWTDDGCLGLSFDLKLGSPRSKTGGAGADNQSNYGDLVADAQAVNILIVEDNEINLKIAKTMLKRMGFEADTAENGLEAVAKLHQKMYHIVLMDCDMPLCNGYDATSHIRTKMHNTSIVIIALTANSTNAAKDRCLSVGMNDYFTKPITQKTLSEMLHKWLPTLKVGEGERGASRFKLEEAKLEEGGRRGSTY